MTKEKRMLHEPTIEKLYTMRLAAMAAAWQQQQGDAHAAELGFDDRFTLLVEAEHIARDNRRLSRLLKQAQLRIPDACVEDIEAGGARGFDKATVRQLATCGWVHEHLNVLISGATGVGKSYVACALGHMACRQGLKVLYRRVPRLFDELSLAKAEGSYARTLAKIAKHELLILDDLGIGQITEPQRHDLLELLDDRYHHAATLVTSQLPIAQWHAWIGDPTLADAILDRLVHNAHKLTLKGPSRRKETAQPEN
jgi:DNA replication protein DnaC